MSRARLRLQLQLQAHRSRRGMALDLVTSALVVRELKQLEMGFTRTERVIHEPLSFEILAERHNKAPGLRADKLKAVLEFVWAVMPQAAISGIIFAYDEAQTLADPYVVFEATWKRRCREAVLRPVTDGKCPLSFSDATVNAIIDRTAGYPYFIQFFCREVFDVHFEDSEGRGSYCSWQISHAN
jgi:hypothetical protein